jgi:hypothetical protein
MDKTPNTKKYAWATWIDINLRQEHTVLLDIKSYQPEEVIANHQVHCTTPRRKSTTPFEGEAFIPSSMRKSRIHRTRMSTFSRSDW